MTEPTDAEILDLWELFVGEPTEEIPLSDCDKLCFARAALRSWGQPSGAGEVVYQSSYKDGFWQDCPRERYEYLKALRIGSSVDWTLRILYTTPQPTQAVPPAGREQITADDLAKRANVGAIHTDRNDNVVLRRHSYREQMEGRFERGWREAEKYHGIKGKEAGNAE